MRKKSQIVHGFQETQILEKNICTLKANVPFPTMFSITIFHRGLKKYICGMKGKHFWHFQLNCNCF